MTVRQLIDALSQYDLHTDVIVADEDCEYDVCITTGHDEGLHQVVVIDLTYDCKRGN